MKHGENAGNNFRTNRWWWISRLFLPNLCCFAMILLLGLFPLSIGSFVEMALVMLCGWSEWGELLYPMVMYVAAAAMLAPWLFCRKQECIQRMVDQSPHGDGGWIHPGKALYSTSLWFCLISELPTVLIAGCIRMIATCVDFTFMKFEERGFWTPLLALIFVVPLLIASVFSWYKMQYVAVYWFLTPEHTFREARKSYKKREPLLHYPKDRLFRRALWVMLLSLAAYAAIFALCTFLEHEVNDMFQFFKEDMAWVLGVLLLCGAGPFLWTPLQMQIISMSVDFLESGKTGGMGLESLECSIVMPEHRSGKIYAVKNSGGQLCISRQSWGGKRKKTMFLSGKAAKGWLETFKALHVESWSAEYTHGDLFDGEEWSLNYKLQNLPVRCVSGFNAYPENWEDFLELLEEPFQEKPV